MLKKNLFSHLFLLLAFQTCASDTLYLPARQWFFAIDPPNPNGYRQWGAVHPYLLEYNGMQARIAALQPGGPATVPLAATPGRNAALTLMRPGGFVIHC